MLSQVLKFSCKNKIKSFCFKTRFFLREHILSYVINDAEVVSASSQQKKPKNFFSMLPLMSSGVWCRAYLQRIRFYFENHFFFLYLRALQKQWCLLDVYWMNEFANNKPKMVLHTKHLIRTNIVLVIAIATHLHTWCIYLLLCLCLLLFH